MNVELRKVKYHEDMSDETNCFSAEVWVDGRKLADVRNDGQGGGHRYDVVGGHRYDGRGNSKWDEFSKWCKAQPHEFDFEHEDQIVNDLFDKWLKADDVRRQQAQLKRWCKKDTVYRLKGEKEGTWWRIKMPYSPAVEARLVTKYGDKLETIANKTQGVTA
jgi:hypothetical protein